MSHTILMLMGAIPHTFTVGIYRGGHGNIGFEGAVTCHAAVFKDHMTLWKLYHCGRIGH
jgi:hypothetical protein